MVQQVLHLIIKGYFNSIHIEWNYPTVQNRKPDSEIIYKWNKIIFKIDTMYHMLILKFHRKKVFSKNTCCTWKKYVSEVQWCHINIIIWTLIWLRKMCMKKYQFCLCFMYIPTWTIMYYWGKYSEQPIYAFVIEFQYNWILGHFHYALLWSLVSDAMLNV